MLNPADIEKYRREGFLTLPGVLPHRFLDELDQAIFEPIARQALHVLGKGFSSQTPMIERQMLMEKLKELAPERYLSALKASQLDPQILASAAHPVLLEILKALGLKHPMVSLKPYPIVIAPNLFFEDGYNIRPAHQEWPVMQGSHNSVVIWFPLHDLEADHSSIEMYPGSHLHGVLPYEVSRCGSKVKDDALSISPVRQSLARGDLIVFSSFTVHRSSPEGNSLRAAMSIRYNDLLDDSFIERAYPDTTTYTITRKALDLLSHEFSG